MVVVVVCVHGDGAEVMGGTSLGVAFFWWDGDLSCQLRFRFFGCLWCKI